MKKINRIKFGPEAVMCNGRDFTKKELAAAWSIIVATKNGPDEIVCVRCYMGRSQQASVVYAAVWVMGNTFYSSGSGKAGGWGYCKQSEAIYRAMVAANIRLPDDIGGTGVDACKRAMIDVVRKLGYKGKTIVVSH